VKLQGRRLHHPRRVGPEGAPPYRHPGPRGADIGAGKKSVAASGNLLSIREAKKTDDWGRDVRQQKAVYVHQNSQGKSLPN